MRCFITGATGFIGRHVVDILLRQGHEVVALVRHNAADLPPAVRAVKADLLDVASLRSSMRGCELAFHLAALITFDLRQRHELRRVNCQGTESLLAAAAQSGVRRAIIASSACTLGISACAAEIRDERRYASLAEEARNPYLASKIAAERAASAFLDRLEVVIVNPTTVYGPGDRTLNSGTLFLRLARGNVIPVPPGGSNVIDVEDTAAGFVAAAERGRSGERYVLGGENLSFAEIFQVIAAALGRSPSWLPLPPWLCFPTVLAVALLNLVQRDRFFTPQIAADLFAFKYYTSAKAKSELGWKPLYTFAESAQRALLYYRARGLLQA